VTLGPVVQSTCQGVTLNAVTIGFFPSFSPAGEGPPPLVTDTTTGEVYLSLYLSNEYVTNRHHYLNPINGSWIVFDGNHPNCTAGENYNFQYMIEQDSFGDCFEVYTVQIPLEFAIQNCGVEVAAQTNQTITLIVTLDITIHEDVVPVDSPNNQTVDRAGFSVQQGEIIISKETTITNPILVAISELNVTAVIYKYFIPQGDAPKLIYVETTIQSFFQLYLVNATEIVPQLSGFPPPSLDSATIQAVSNGCIADASLPTLCIQQWLVTIDVAPSVCNISAIYSLFYGVTCASDISQCPLPSNQNATFYLDVTTDDFCDIIIGNFQFTGTSATYYDDFSAIHTGFFENDTVGVEVTVVDQSNNNLPAQSVELIFFSGILSSDTSLPLFLDTGFVDNSFSHILVGGTTVQDGLASIIAEIEPNVCDVFPFPGMTGCPGNVLRFRFKLDSTLWYVPPDTYLPFRMGMGLQLYFNGVKRDVFVNLGQQQQSNNLKMSGQAYVSPLSAPQQLSTSGAAINPIVSCTLVCLGLIVFFFF